MVESKSNKFIPIEQLEPIDLSLSIILERLNRVEVILYEEYGYRNERDCYYKITHETYPDEIINLIGKANDITERLDDIFTIFNSILTNEQIDKILKDKNKV